MTYILVFAPSVKKTLKKWKKSNPSVFEKASKILEELVEHPRTGTGHPEPLKGKASITWSRHITARDRIIYDIFEELVQVNVLEIEGHYDDK